VDIVNNENNCASIKLILIDELSYNLKVLINYVYQNQHIPKRNNLNHIRFHDLRHSCASLLLKSGVDMKTTSTILGHSSIGITMDLYSHIDIEQKIDAAVRINNILQM